jgi:hypothetical protein
LKQFSDNENITFHFAQGYLDSQPPHWLAEQLEGPPHLRFFQWNSALLDIGYDTHVQKHGVPNLKEGMWGIDVEPEQLEDDKLAPLFIQYMNNPPEPWSVGVALEYLHNIIEDEGPFHGVIGVSEGASVASTLLIEDIQHCQAVGIRSNFRCGLFYIGAPAWSADGTKAVLSEEYGQVINIPTCHVMGAKDVFKVGAEQLLKICNSDEALVIHDSGGHRMPQDMPTNKKIADWVREQEREFMHE